MFGRRLSLLAAALLLAACGEGGKAGGDAAGVLDGGPEGAAVTDGGAAVSDGGAAGDGQGDGIAAMASKDGVDGMDSVDGMESLDGVDGVPGAAGECAIALPVSCGDRLNHSTVTHGRANGWNGHGNSARYASGRETIYGIRTASTCAVVANLKNLTTDLDLHVMSACDPLRANLDTSSTPLDLQTIETVDWTASPGKLYYLVVDGYDRAEGSYTLEVDCACPPPTARTP